MEDKTVAYSLFGVIGIVVLVGIVIAITTASTGMGVYGGGMRRMTEGYVFPYEQYRTVQAGVREVPGYVYPQQSVPVSQSSAAYELTDHAIFQNRYPPRVHTVMTSCRGQMDLGTVPQNYLIELSSTEAYDTYGPELNGHCVAAPHFPGKYCCEWKGTTSRIY